MSAQQIEGDVLIALGNGVQAESAAIEAVLGPLTVTAASDVETYAEGIAEKINPTLGALAKVAVAQYGAEFVTWAEGQEKVGVPEFGAWLVSKGEALAGEAPPAAPA